MEDKAARNPEEEIYQLIRGQFKAAEKHADRVKDLIKDYYPSYAKLNRTSLLMIIKSIRKDFKREDWPEVKYMFKSIFVYIISDHKPHLHLTHISELIDSYPEFADADDVEKSLLLQFRNLFNVACEIIDPKNHKGELIALVGRMCGAIYVTGGGQTTATDRRVLLYERETGIAPRKQPERKRRADDPATISLAALHSRHTYYPANAFSSKVPMPNEINPILVKRPRYEAPDTQTLLRSADSFWSYHRALMETGEDIPFKTVPADQAYASFAYPSHDLPFTGTGYGPAAAHPSMRFLHDPLRRPQMPMSMQMQLPPPRGSQLPPPLPLSLQYGGSGARPAGTLGGPMPGQQHQQHHPNPHQLPASLQMQMQMMPPPAPRFDYGGYPGGGGSMPMPGHGPGHPSMQFSYYDRQPGVPGPGPQMAHGLAPPGHQHHSHSGHGGHSGLGPHGQLPSGPGQARGGMYLPPPGQSPHNGPLNGPLNGPNGSPLGGPQQAFPGQMQGQGQGQGQGQRPGQGQQGYGPLMSLQQLYGQSGSHLPAHGHAAHLHAHPGAPSMYAPASVSVQNKA